MKEIIELLAATLWFWTFSLGFLVSIIVTIAAAFCPKMWYILGIIFIYILFDRETGSRGGRPLEWVRNCAWWKYMKSYFNYKIVTDGDLKLDPKTSYLFACYPHGIYPCGPFAGFVDGCKDLFPQHKTYITALGIQFWLPVIRDLFLAVGSVSVNAMSLLYLLRYGGPGGNIVSLVVGGGEEAKYSKPGKYKIILNKRKGFIKLCLQNGAPIVPVFTFGENEIFNQLEFPGLSIIKNIVQKITGIYIVIPVGKYLICPNRVPIVTVVGQPIQVPRECEPSKELINEYHAKFVDALKTLFETHKHKYIKNPDQAVLEIV